MCIKQIEGESEPTPETGQLCVNELIYSNFFMDVGESQPDLTIDGQKIDAFIGLAPDDGEQSSYVG